MDKNKTVYNQDKLKEKIYEIIQIYKNEIDEPLDGDETEKLSKIILNEIDYIEGNVTDKEYKDFNCEQK